jgi:putative addiction module component (TIGR02574 family)
MARAEGSSRRLEPNHLRELLRMPLEDRARAARALLDSLDEDGEEEGVEQAHLAELIRRMEALEAGQVHVINDADARSRVLARLRSLRGR